MHILEKMFFVLSFADANCYAYITKQNQYMCQVKLSAPRQFLTYSDKDGVYISYSHLQFKRQFK